MLKNLLIRPADQKDLNDIAIFENRFFLNDCYSMRNLEEIFHNSNYQIIIVEYEQKNIAYLIYMKSVDFNEILKIGVDENYRNLKIGSLLIDLLKQKKQNILLEVSDLNTNALNFYLKHGFMKQNIRKRYYANGSDAILMIWKYNQT